LGRFPHSEIVLRIYYVHQGLLGTLLSVQWEVACRRGITVEGLAEAERVRMRFRLWRLPAVCGAALAAAALGPNWPPVAILVALLIFRLIAWRRAQASM